MSRCIAESRVRGYILFTLEREDQTLSFRLMDSMGNENYFDTMDEVHEWFRCNDLNYKYHYSSESEEVVEDEDDKSALHDLLSLDHHLTDSFEPNAFVMPDESIQNETIDDRDMPMPPATPPGRVLDFMLSVAQPLRNDQRAYKIITEYMK